jgi:hypothetical protein
MYFILGLINAPSLLDEMPGYNESHELNSMLHRTLRAGKNIKFADPVIRGSIYLKVGDLAMEPSTRSVADSGAAMALVSLHCTKLITHKAGLRPSAVLSNLSSP